MTQGVQIPVSTADLARLVAHLGRQVQRLTERVADLEQGRDTAQKRQKKREAMLRRSERQAAITLRATMNDMRDNSIAAVACQVSKEMGIALPMLLSRHQNAPIVAARHEVYLRACEIGKSASDIARAVGRDRTTVLHGINAALNRRSAAQARMGEAA